MVGGLASFGGFIVRSSALVMPYLGLFPFVLAFLSSIFVTIILLLFLCLLLPLAPSAAHARDILCGIHTS